MVSFTPNLQSDNAPSYLGLSHAVSKQELGADRSDASIVSGIGDVFKDAVVGTDETFKGIINDALQNKVDTEREGMTGALEGIAGVPQQNRVASTQPDMGAGDPSLTGTQNVPSAIQSGLAKASNLQNASGNGKLNPSFYEGRLDMIAKDLRSQYPGYREYIDQKMSEMTGGNPANKYMQELLQQINTGIQNNLTEKEKNLSYVRENAGLPNAMLAAQKVQSGEWKTPDVVKWASGNKSILATAAQTKAELDTRVDSNANKAIDAKQALTDQGNSLVLGGMVTLGDALGGPTKFGDLGDVLKKIATGPGVPEEQSRQLAQSLSVYRQAQYLEQKKLAEANGALKYAKPEEVEAIITNNLKPIDSTLQHLTDKEYGPAYQDFHMSQSINDRMAVMLQTNKSDLIRKYFQIAGAANKIGGPNIGVNVLKDFVSGGLPTELKSAVDLGKLDIATQTDPNNPATIKGYVETLRKGGVGVVDPNDPSGVAKKPERKAFESLLELPKVLQDPAVPDTVKLNIIKGSYGPANVGLTGMFDDDRMVGGQLIKGRHSLFAGMTSPQNVDQIKSLDDKSPGAWDHFKRWAETEHAGLFTNDIKTLDGLSEDASRFKVAYNSDRHEFSLVRNPAYGGPTKFTDSMQFDQGGPYQFTLAKINSSLKNMAYIAQKDGRDPNAYVLSTLRGAGVDAENPLAKAVLTATGKQSDNTPELEQLKPESAKTSLHTTVGQAESNENYDSLFGTKSNAKLTDMTVGEVMALQKHHTDSGSPSSAAGYYQILRPTLSSLVKEGKVNPNDKFDQDTQDRLATALMERRGLNEFKAGKITKEQFANNLAKEFAGLPTTSGQSYYEGDGLNHATVKLPQVLASLGGL